MKLWNLSLSSAERAVASEQIFACVEQLPLFAAAGCVALYCSLDDEPATDEVLVRWSASKRIVLPRVEGDTMQFYDYSSCKMCKGAFGIAEPQPEVGSGPCDPSQIDLILVPGTAFTASGARLGRGRGYYDKYLSQNFFQGFKVGVCYAHQLVTELPVEPHDVRMDSICAK